MNLQPINPPAPVFSFACSGCNETRTSEGAHADLDGEPFRAYFCWVCVARFQIQARQSTQEATP
jgi:hypothetical protein